jgi:hypothetical protein
MPGKPDSPDTASYIRTLPEAECFELLAVANVGRVGFVSPTGLQIIPMNYRLGADHQLFMKTAPGTRWPSWRRSMLTWPGPASSLPVSFVPRTVSGRGLHRTRQDWER